MEHNKGKTTSRNRVIFLSLGLITIPFLLIRDFFPLMRMGMFAETPNSIAVAETFFVTHNHQNVTEAQTGISKQTLIFLARNHYYRGEKEIFLTKIAKRLPKPGTTQLFKVSYGDQTDTTLIHQLTLP